MDLASQLANRPYGPEILELTAYIGNDPERFAALVKLVLADDKTIAQYASWLVNHCMKKHPELIQPHLEVLISNLAKPKLSESVIRSTVKALSETDIPPELQGYALDHCFNFLLDPKRPVAIQVHAMQTIFNISRNEPDLLRELKLVIEEGMPHGSAGYKARGRRIFGGDRKGFKLKRTLNLLLPTKAMQHDYKTIDKDMMNRRPVRCLIGLLILALHLNNCSLVQSDKAQILEQMNSLKQGFLSQDLDAIMQCYSENFAAREAANKTQMRALLEEANALGMLKNVDLNLETAELVIIENTAEIIFYDEEGEVDMDFSLTKEKGKSWLITGIPSETCSYENYSSPYGDDCVQDGPYQRCWDILVPEGLPQIVPLVIDLHGWTDDPAAQRSISGFEDLAKSEGFIIVWPYGLCRSWNAGAQCCAPAADDQIDDVGFIRQMIAKLSGQYSIDTNRVYVTGLSNGCAMTQRLANEASDLIAAAACMSLQLLVPKDPTYAPVSVMTLMGTNDDLYEASDTPGALKNFELWKEMNNCKGNYEISWQSGKSVAWTYKDCEHDTEIALVTIDQGGHLLYQGEDTDINTTQLAWDFMKRFKNH